MDSIDEDTDMSKSAVVKCLMGITELQAAAEGNDVKLSTDTTRYLMRLLLQRLAPSHIHKLINKSVEEGHILWDDTVYEVDYIVDHCKDDDTDEMWYLIKWEGFSDHFNSWEPSKNLQCDKVIEDYNGQLKESRGVKRKFKADDCDLSVLIGKLCEKLTPQDVFKMYSPIKQVKKLKPLIGVPSPFLRQSSRHGLHAVRKVGKISKKKKKEEIMAALKDWEKKINHIAQGVDTASILVVNDVDLEGPPDMFVFINKCKEGPGVTIPKDPLLGCECEDCYSSRNTCCAACSQADFAYYKGGRIRLSSGRPVYECNDRCKCGPDCVNRVVQKGRRFKICIFRTKNGRGWGVKTLQLIKKGSFVMEYVGEVITHEEAERRGQVYDAAGRTYLFDLDYADNNNSFTVDAGLYGNAAHFINHSCDPNMEVYCVWINCLDARLPHICLFAKRDIQKNEELSFDYMCSRANAEEESHPTDSSISENQVPGDVTPFSDLSSNDLNPAASAVPVQPETENSLVETGHEVAVGDVGDGFSTKGIIISPRKESIINHFSMVCQCGAANCRKYLF